MPPKGRPKDKEAENSNTRDAVLENETTWLKKAMNDSQEQGKEYYPPLTQRSFDKLKKNRDNLLPEFWSDADEAQVLAQWDLVLAKKPFKQPHPKEQSLWKTSARFLRCLPTELIGMRYGLECDAGQTASQNWTQGFCANLIKIIAHPIFANNPAKIALAIKFSVCSWQILKWGIPDVNDAFLQMVQKVAEKKSSMTGAELVRDSIEEWRDIWPEEGELPPWAQLLKEIVVYSKRPVSAAESPHRVATHHLSAIIISLDKISHAKLVLYHSTSLYERRIKDIRTNIDKPTAGQDTIEELQAEGTVHNRRLRVLSERHPDVADIYKHVSQPEEHRPVPKDDFANIYVEVSEPEEPSEPEQPIQTTQANPPAKRKPGRPKKVLQNATPVGHAPKESGANPRLNNADVDVPQNDRLDNTNNGTVQVARRLGEPQRPRNNSVSAKIASASEQQIAPLTGGLPSHNNDFEDHGLHQNDNDLHEEYTIFDNIHGSPQRLSGSSPSETRPGTLHSDDLGQDTPADDSLACEYISDEDVNTEGWTDGTTSDGLGIAGPIRSSRRPVVEATPVSADDASPAFCGPLAAIDTIHRGVPISSLPGLRPARYSLVPRAYESFQDASEVETAEEKTEWLPDESSSRAPDKEFRKPSNSNSARGKKRKRNPMPTYSSGSEE